MTNGGLVLLGSGGHCRSVIDVLESAGEPIAGIVQEVGGTLGAVMGYPVLGHDGDLDRLRKEYAAAMVAVGQIKSPAIRIRLFLRLKELGFSLKTVTSPLAHVAPSARLGEGTIVMHHALVNAMAAIGHNCIINSKALVEHDCRIADHCHIAVSAVVCGGVSVGEGSFIGAGALVHPRVSIGSGCVIGMGAKVRNDVADGRLFV